MTTLQQLTSGQASPEVPINRNFAALSALAIYSYRESASSGLTWAYYGGLWGGTTIADGTLTLTASSTCYVVVAYSSGAISVSTASTNWSDTSNYCRVYKVTTGTTGVTATEDHRAGPYGLFGRSGGSSGSTSYDKARAYLATATNTTTAGWQKVPLDTASFDTNSIFDTTNKRFLPKQAGYYQVNLRARTGTSAQFLTGIYKNGGLYEASGFDATCLASNGSSLVYCNGTSDYLELWCYASTARALTTGTVDTFMSLVGPF